jgi:transcriptional regulator with XRE-family HTH domain
MTTSDDEDVRACPPPTGADLGRAVRRLRHVRRLSGEDLAHLAGMHPTYLSEIERGLGNPTWQKITDLASALRLPALALIRAAEGEAYGGLYPLTDETYKHPGERPSSPGS